MKIKGVTDNCDGKGPQLVEVEVPDPSPEQLAARTAKREERMKARGPKKA